MPGDSLKFFQTRKGSLEIFHIFVRQVAIGHQDFELWIKSQERLQQVLLAPKAKFTHYPVAPVLERQKDVVDMYNNARLQTRQDFQKQVIDVSANFHRMRTVDKQEIA